MAGKFNSEFNLTLTVITPIVKLISVNINFPDTKQMALLKYGSVVLSSFLSQHNVSLQTASKCPCIRGGLLRSYVFQVSWRNWRAHA